MRKKGKRERKYMTLEKLYEKGNISYTILRRKREINIFYICIISISNCNKKIMRKHKENMY